MNDSNRRLAAIMFTDIVGYSALAQKNETVSLEILEDHRKLLRTIFGQFGGIEIKTTGDGFLAEFASALQAVRCAIDIQKAVTDHNTDLERDRQFEIRIGIHVGDIVHEDSDVLGDGVNIASRIEPLAEPGGICLTEQVYDHVHNKVEVHIARLGRKHLKNIDLPMEVYRVVLPWEKRDPTVSQIVQALGGHQNKRAKGAKVFAGTVAGVGVAFLVFLLLNNTSPPQKVAVGVEGRTVNKINASEATAPAIRSIAVLPFSNNSPDATDEFFADGITEELISVISKIEGIRVPARTSAFAFKGKNVEPGIIGRKLAVDSILTGSVRRDGEMLKITAELLNVDDVFPVWRETFEDKLTGIFNIQEEIARKIAGSLEEEISGDFEMPQIHPPTAKIEAYKCYLKGRQSWRSRTEEGFNEALACFQKAISEDPQYAQAYSGLADTYHLMNRYGFLADDVANEQVRAYAQRALELDGSLAEVHATLGTIMEAEWQWERAEKSYRSSIELDPNYAQARHWYAILLSKLGRTDEAFDQMRQALTLDPLSPVINRSFAMLYTQTHRFEEALEQYRIAAELTPNPKGDSHYLGIAYADVGQYEKALEMLDIQEQVSGRNFRLMADRAHFYARMGNTEKARDLLGRIREDPESGKSLAWIGMLLVRLGDIDKGFETLEKAYEAHDFGLTYMKVFPVLDKVRSDPRYADLVRRIGLEPEPRPAG